MLFYIALLEFTFVASIITLSGEGETKLLFLMTVSKIIKVRPKSKLTYIAHFVKSRVINIKWVVRVFLYYIGLL